MTVTKLNAKYSRVTPDEGMILMMPNDENQYSTITILTKKVNKVIEVPLED